MSTIHLTPRHRRPSPSRRRAGLAVETMEHRLVLSPTLPAPHAAAAVVAPYFPPDPV